MINIRIVAITLLTLLQTSISNGESLPVPKRGFISCRPAETWEEGLICGNGTIGANALSRPENERVIFTHERLFMPMGAPVMPQDQSVRLFEIRRLIERGLYKQACQLQFDLSGQKGFMYPDFYVPAFDLKIDSKAQGEIVNYCRSVDFAKGETAVAWADERGNFERRMFVSRAAGVAVLKMTGPKSSLNCTLSLVPREPSAEFNKDSDINKRSDEMFKEHVDDIVSSAGKDWLSYSNRYIKAYPGSIQALNAHARVEVMGGIAGPDSDGGLAVRGADSALIFIDIRPLYDSKASTTEEMQKELAELPIDYQKLLGEHAELHGKLFNRVALDIGGGSAHQLPTEVLLEKSTLEKPNPALVEKQFDAGRYNIICSTGQLPPTLQGVWGGTYVPGWASDFTHNGNVPSAIAANLMGNMPELTLAYTSYIESLIPWMEINAQHMFGARGIVLPSRSTTHGFNNAFNGGFAGGMWVSGAGWASHFFYDYYLYTGDRKFLADHALPFMEQAVMFFEDYLYEGPDGKFIFSPTQSPENSPGNSNSQATYNATMDVAVAKELFRNTIAASRELGRNADKIPVWEEMLTKMPDYMVNEQGIIKEWLTPRLANNDNHRHSSQLYPLYDGLPEEIDRSPELRSAFRKSIEHKIEEHWTDNQRGFMSFGLVQLGQCATSLGDSELSYHCLRHLSDRFWFSNLASTHNAHALFNMDISGGMPAVIIKMLVSSEPGKVTLLPALPNKWKTGTLEGALCRGAIELERLHWSEGTVEARMRSKNAQAILLELPSEIVGLTVSGGEVIDEVAESPNQTVMELPAGQPVSVVIKLK